jgi:hypothetical protein
MANATLSTIANGQDMQRKKSGWFDMPVLPARFPSRLLASACRIMVKKNKKTDVAEHQQVFHHVGLLANEPLGTPGLLSI